MSSITRPAAGRALVVTFAIFLVALLGGCKPAAAPKPAEPIEKDIAAFFVYAPNYGTNLPEDEIFPRGRTMAYGLYSVLPPQLDNIRAKGFTMIGPYYGPQADVVGRARGANAKCAYTVGGPHIDFNIQDVELPSDAQLRAVITAEVQAVASNSEIAVWNLIHEELRPWRSNELHWLEVATAAVHAADPLRRPVVMFEPCHADASRLARTVKYQDICMKGMYANASGYTYQRAWIPWSVEQETTAISVANTAAVPYAVMWMAKDPDDPAEAGNIKHWCRHDVYASLVAGAKGIFIWSGDSQRKGFEATFSNYFEAYAEVGDELGGSFGFAQLFLFGTWKHDLRLSVTSGPTTVSFRVGSLSNAYPSVSMANIAFGTSRYVFLVNSAAAYVAVRVDGLPGTPVAVQNMFSDISGKTTKIHSYFSTFLAPWEVKCFQFSPP